MSRLSAAAAATAAVVIAIYALRLDHAAGLMVDDAWYIVLAKGIAQGDGPRLISSAVTPILPAVPPGYPAILATIFLINPSFPDNVIWFKLISVLAMLGAGVACWMDFTRYRGVPASEAVMLAAAALITPAFVFLATSTVMAECVFTLAVLVTILLVERTARDQEPSNRHALIAGLAAAATMMIRTAGVALVVAAIIYLLIGKRRRQAALLALTVAVCVAPWQIYSFANAPTNEQRLANGGTIAFSYPQLLAMGRPGDQQQVSMGFRVARAGQNLAGIVSRDMGGIFVPAIYRGPSESGQELLSIAGGTAQIGSMGRGPAIAIVSLLLSAVMFAGWSGSRREWFSLPVLFIAATIAMILLVGSQTFRYLVPLTPYLLLLFWRGLRSGVVARVALLCVLGFNLLDHAGYIHQKVTATPDWLADAREVDEVLEWMTANVHEPGPVASTNPGLLYLRTGWKGMVNAFPDQNWQAWKSAGVRYVVALKRTELPASSLGGRVIFQTKRRLWIVQM